MFSIEPIFPIAVLNANIQRELTHEELQCVFKHRNNVRKSYGNYQSENTHILDEPEFKDIKSFIEQAIKHYKDTVIIANDNLEIYITQSWLSFTNPGNFHHKHSHPNSFLSGVFYINAKKDLDIIQFEQDNTGLYYISKQSNIFNAKTVSASVGTGDLIMFPSNLNHQVPTTSHNEIRVSLAFNTFVKGELGNDQSLTHLFL